MSAPRHYATAAELAQDVDRRVEPVLLDAIERGWPGGSEATGEGVLDRYLEQNRAALQAWRLGAQGDGAEYAVDELGVLPLRKLQVLQRLALLDARRLGRDGRDDEALETLTWMLRFARHYAGGARGNQVRLVEARMVEHAASELILELVERSACGDEAWRAALDVLEEGAEGRIDFEVLLANDWRERLAGLRADFEVQGTWEEPFAQRVHATVRERLDDFSPLFTAAWRSGDVTPLEHAIAKVTDEADTRSRIGVVLDENELVRAQASLVLAIALPVEAIMLRYELVGRARMDMLRLRVAWHLRETGTGRPPSSLEALVPEWLEAVPRDPFDPREPLRVAHGLDGWWLYSVGPDREDQGGAIAVNPTDDDRTGDLLLRPSYVLAPRN